MSGAELNETKITGQGQQDDVLARSHREVAPTSGWTRPKHDFVAQHHQKVPALGGT
jgi:hypothetical protein